MPIPHEFDPGYTGLSVLCNQLVLDEDGAGTTCSRPKNEHMQPLPLHRTEAGYPNCSTCDSGGCPDCTDPA